MKLSREGDYRLQEQWLERHRDATYLVVEKETGLIKEAIYTNPIYTLYAITPKRFLERVKALMEEEC